MTGNSVAQTATVKDCIHAVNNAPIYLEAKQHIAQQRKDAGDFSEADYQTQLHQLTIQAQRITLDQCARTICIVPASGQSQRQHQPVFDASFLI